MSGPRYDTSDLRDGSAEERVEYALEQIEGAQMLLAAAAANLSPIIGVVRDHQAASKLYHQVNQLWHRLNSRLERSRGKLQLDGSHEAARAARLAGGAR